MRFILFFCLLCVTVSAQSPKHFLGLNFAPAATNNLHKSTIETSQNWLSQGSYYFGGSAGASALWAINSRLKLQTDIIYSAYSERFKYSINIMEIDPNHGFVLPSEETDVALIYEYHTLSFPILLNVYLNDQRSKWAWFASGGARGHIYLNRYSSTISEYSEIESTRTRVSYNGDNPNNAFNLSAQIGFGLDYNKSQNFRFRIAPYFEHFLFNTLKSSTNSEEFPYAFGLTLGAYWKL